MNTLSNNVSFKSRNINIRKVDKICRFVNTEFPAISSSKIPQRCNYNKACKPLFDRIHNKLLSGVREPLEFSKNNISKFISLIINIKKHHVANCAELTYVTQGICNINGLKTKPIQLVLVDKAERFNGYADHVVLAIPLKNKEVKIDKLSKLKDVIIVDPWLGIADYAPKVEEKYLKDFKKFFEKPGQKIDNLSFSSFSDSFGLIELSNSDVQILKNKFPQFQILNKNK